MTRQPAVRLVVGGIESTSRLCLRSTLGQIVPEGRLRICSIRRHTAGAIRRTKVLNRYRSLIRGSLSCTMILQFCLRGVVLLRTRSGAEWVPPVVSLSTSHGTGQVERLTSDAASPSFLPLLIPSHQDLKFESNPPVQLEGRRSSLGRAPVGSRSKVNGASKRPASCWDGCTWPSLRASLQP